MGFCEVRAAVCVHELYGLGLALMGQWTKMGAHMSETCAVITTIQPPTGCVRRLAQHAAALGIPLIVMGDKKGPARSTSSGQAGFPLPGAAFYSFDAQQSLPYKLARLLPAGHYARKNLGYLVAIGQGAGCLYETDDDNAPLPGWRPREPETEALRLPASKWCNVYRYFTDEQVWPRGLPLNELSLSGDPPALDGLAPVTARFPVQQGLANGAPDVDAVWRLVLDKPVTFNKGPALRLPKGSWCPFNSQNTWWWKEAFPLLYLPSHCSFRMTDIWRGFVAQRCLWAMGRELLFFAADVEQERNAHNLMRDFEDEIPGYLHNDRIVDLLAGLELAEGVDAAGQNLLACYKALVTAGFVPAEELALVEAWLEDVEKLRGVR